MRTRSCLFLGTIFFVVGASASACSSSGHSGGGVLSAGDAQAGACQGSNCEDSTLGDGGAAGSNAGASGSDSGTVAGCVPQATSDDPDDAFTDANCDGIDGDKSNAIFVSPQGADGASGSFASPVKSIRQATELAAKQGKDVYVCTAEYAENVVVDTKSVNIYGGYDCSDWSRGNTRAKIAPPSGTALTIRNVTSMSVDRLMFASADATNPGASSVAVFVANAGKTSFSHIDATAGAGAAGKPGDVVLSDSSVAAAGVVGQDYAACVLSVDGCQLVARVGGDKAPTSCGLERVHGGAGGDGADPHVSPSTPLRGDSGSGGKGSAVPGADGHPGAPGAPAADGFGSVTTDGYVPSNAGGNGGIGATGASGGGGKGGYSCGYYSQDLGDCERGGLGNSWTVFGAGGGQGGYGGCGGFPGKPGGAGGASIAILSFNSQLSISWGSLSTSAGGDGGVPSDGGAGQKGGAGGNGGAAVPDGHISSTLQPYTAGQDGARGGNGGKGGPGGPGGGGPSITLVAVGDAPTTQAVTFTPAAGGKGAAGLSGQDAASGESSDVKVIAASAAADGGS